MANDGVERDGLRLVMRGREEGMSLRAVKFSGLATAPHYAFDGSW